MLPTPGRVQHMQAANVRLKARASRAGWSQDDRDAYAQLVSRQVRRFWAYLTPKQRRATQAHRNKIALSIQNRWEGLSQEERKTIAQHISEGQKRRWAQRSQAQRAAISAKRVQTQMRNKQKHDKHAARALAREEAARGKRVQMTAAERNIMNRRSPFQTKVSELSFHLKHLDDDTAYRMFWNSLTPTQKKRVLRLGVEAFSHGISHTTTSAIQ